MINIRNLQAIQKVAAFFYFATCLVVDYCLFFRFAVFTLGTNWMNSHTVGPNTGNVHQCYPALNKKTKNSVASVYVQSCAVHIFGAFSTTYLQVVDAHRTTVRSGHVVVHTLPKAAQTSRVRVAAGLRA